jgi:hypothetical protein
VNLTGAVVHITDDVNFVKTMPFTSPADLKVQGADGRTVSGTWDGSNPFLLEGVVSAPSTWVLATPQNPLAADALPSMEVVETDQPDAEDTVSADVGLVQASSIEQILDSSTVPVSVDPSLAQLIIRLVDKSSSPTNPTPLAGVKVALSSAENILYGASGGFSDVATETDPTGMVVLANVPGAAWPGAIVNLEFSGTKTGGDRVPAVTGAVTLTTLPL